jgi:hypothetical protein
MCRFEFKDVFPLLLVATVIRRSSFLWEKPRFYLKTFLWWFEFELLMQRNNGKKTALYKTEEQKITGLFGPTGSVCDKGVKFSKSEDVFPHSLAAVI